MSSSPNKQNPIIEQGDYSYLKLSTGLAYAALTA